MPRPIHCSVSDRIEICSVILIALAVAIGGRSLLMSITHYQACSLVLLGLFLILQFAALRRNYEQGGPSIRIRATRDVAFIATILLALIVVAYPQKWSVGATIVALEFSFALDLLRRWVPQEG